MNKVIVRFSSRQYTADCSANDAVNTTALGNHHLRNGVSYIIYKEKILDDNTETSTMLKLTDESLVLTRSGGVKQQQIFAKGKQSTSDYVTPYGKLKLTVKTHRFEIVNDAHSRMIKIEYALYLNDRWQSNNELNIQIQPAN